MLTPDEQRSLNLTEPNDQRLAFEHVKEMMPEMITEMDWQFAQLGAGYTKERLVAAVNRMLAEIDGGPNADDLLLASMLGAAYEHMYRTHRKQAN